MLKAEDGGCLQHRQKANGNGGNPDEATPRCGASLADKVEYPTEDFQNPSQGAECQHYEEDDDYDTHYSHNTLLHIVNY